MAIINHQETERQLRDLLAAGRSAGEALRDLHSTGRYGALQLYRAIEAVCQVSQQDAMRLVVRELSLGQG